MPLQVKLVISKNDENDNEQDGKTKDPRMTKSLADLDFQNADEDTNMYKMDVESIGKYSRKATWDDLNRFTGLEMNSDLFRDWIVHYQETCFPEDATKENHVPKKCFIKDENGYTIFKDFGWKPIKLNLQTGLVDVKKKYTKEVCLESFPLDYSTNLEQILLEQGDKKISSTLRKTKLAGHPLALEMMQSDSEVTTEFKGLDSVSFGVFGNKEPSEIDDETGDELWKDVKSLRALLHNAELPKKSGAGVTREARVLANESYLKARIYYKCFFSNDVATDHEAKFDGKRYWKFPIKYLFQYNDMPNAIVVHEDIELKFFTDIRVAMDNKDWEWVKDENGRWKKQFAAVSTSVSRRKSDGASQMPEAAENPLLAEMEAENEESETKPEAKLDTESKPVVEATEEDQQPEAKIDTPEPQVVAETEVESKTELLTEPVDEEESEVMEEPKRVEEQEEQVEDENKDPGLELKSVAEVAEVESISKPANSAKPDPDGLCLHDVAVPTTVMGDEKKDGVEP